MTLSAEFGKVIAQEMMSNLLRINSDLEGTLMGAL